MKAQKTITTVFTILGTVAMAAIVLSIVANVVLRTVFNKPIIWIIEANGIFVVWLTFMVLGVNSSLDRHFKIEFVSLVASDTTKRVLFGFKDLIVLITVVCLGWFTVFAIRDNFTITTSVIEIRVWIAYYLPALIGALHALVVLVDRHRPRRARESNKK